MAKSRLEGLRKVQAAFEKKYEDVKRATPEAITEVALDLIGKAKELAPIDTGDLRGSGFTVIEKKGDSATATVGFNTPYAVRQHEEMDYRHPQGGQAKYLEQPFNENIEKYIKHLRDSIKKEVD